MDVCRILLLFALTYAEVNNRFYILSIIRGNIAQFAIYQVNQHKLKILAVIRNLLHSLGGWKS